MSAVMAVFLWSLIVLLVGLLIGEALGRRQALRAVAADPEIQAAWATYRNSQVQQAVTTVLRRRGSRP
jgi:uncharacterized protein YneF (UPF0154 family)